MNAALAGRVQQLDAEREHRAAVAEFRARRAADEQARINAQLTELVAALASLPFRENSSRECQECYRALAPRSRTCPNCRADVSRASA